MVSHQNATVLSEAICLYMMPFGRGAFSLIAFSGDFNICQKFKYIYIFLSFTSSPGLLLRAGGREFFSATYEHITPGYFSRKH